MSGRVDPGPTGSGWGAILLVGLTQGDPATGILVAPLDARALGIAQIRFTLENSPLAGVLPQIAQLESADCRKAPDCLSTFSAAAAIPAPGTATLPLTDFTNPDAEHPDTTLDPTLVTGVQFYLGPLPRLASDFRFCINGLAFLDAGGREITP